MSDKSLLQMVMGSSHISMGRSHALTTTALRPPSACLELMGAGKLRPMQPQENLTKGMVMLRGVC